MEVLHVPCNNLSHPSENAGLHLLISHFSLKSTIYFLSVSTARCCILSTKQAFPRRQLDVSFKETK